MTLRGSSILGGMGHISQKGAHFLLKVLPAPGISDWRLRDKSHARKVLRSLAEVSIFLTELEPQHLHLKRVLPAFVFPFLTILEPQTGQRGFPMATSQTDRPHC